MGVAGLLNRPKEKSNKVRRESFESEYLESALSVQITSFGGADILQVDSRQ